jgi:hypothetical protein
MTTNTIADNTAPKSIQSTKRMSIGLSGETIELLEFLADNHAIFVTSKHDHY